MNAWRLFRWVLWRGIFTGAILGSAFGVFLTTPYTLSGAIGICFIGFFSGALLGAGLGGILGVINAVALVILSRLLVSRRDRLRSYRWSALVMSVIITVFSSLLTVHLLFGDLPFVLIPVTLLAAIAAGCFAWRLPDVNLQLSEAAHITPANAVLFYIEK